MILILILIILRLMILIGQQPVTDSVVPSAAEEAESGFCSLASDRLSLLPATRKDLFGFVGILGFPFDKNLQTIFKETGLCSFAPVRPSCTKRRRGKRDNVLVLCGLLLISRNWSKLVQGNFLTEK